METRALKAWAKRMADGIVFPGLPPLEYEKAKTFLEFELAEFLKAYAVGQAGRAATEPTAHHGRNCFCNECDPPVPTATPEQCPTEGE